MTYSTINKKKLNCLHFQIFGVIKFDQNHPYKFNEEMFLY